jgi:hypothetical protein
MFLNMILFDFRNREYNNILQRLILKKCQTICCFRLNYSNSLTRQKNRIEGWLVSSIILDLKVFHVPSKNERNKDEAAQITCVRGKDIMRVATWQKFLEKKSYIYIDTRKVIDISFIYIYIEQGDGSLANECNKLQRFFSCSFSL